MARVRSWLDPAEPASTVSGVLSAVLTVAATTLIIFPLKGVIDAPALDALYIPAILFLAAKWDVAIGMLAAVLGALAFSYFHIAPVHQFTGLGSEGVAFLAVVVGAMWVAGLSGRARTAEERRRQEVVARRRVLAASDEERRRVVRDLHDGAQQRLVHAVIVLKLALRKLRDSDDEARQLVEAALGHAEAANAELRELAHGILPSVLTRGGLRAGVDSLVARTSTPTEVDVPDDRFAPAIEATAYFVISEALTNVVKHAHAHSASVAARVQRGQLEIRVTDDGIGGAHTNAANGLAGLEDRLSTLGGRLIVDSPRGIGTRVSAVLPLSDEPTISSDT